MPCVIGTVVHDPSVRNLCYKEYPGHPRGCPNYRERATCPPQAPLLSDIQDVNFPTFIIWNRFAFGEHIKRMKYKHPEWSERQLANCLYWQGTARKKLKESIEVFKRLHPNYEVTQCPEAMGVNVTATMKLLWISLEWPPVHYARQVAVGFVRITASSEEHL